MILFGIFLNLITKETKFDQLLDSKDEIINQLISTFYLSGGRIPLQLKENCKLLTIKGTKKFLKEGNNTYLKEHYGDINENNIYSYYLHLYHSFHWQGGIRILLNIFMNLLD